MFYLKKIPEQFGGKKMENLRGSKNSEERRKKQYAILEDSLAEKGIDLENIKEILKSQVVELPSWAVGNSGTRYGTFMDKGAAVTIWDKVDDCAEIQRCLGITPVMASHVLWDKTDDGRFEPVREYAAKKGMRIGTVHPNTFSGQEFRFGSICSPIESVRENTRAHFIDCIRIAREMGSRCIGMWLADGTSYPGQDSLADGSIGFSTVSRRSMTPWIPTWPCFWSTSPSSPFSTPPTFPTGGPLL
jgi:L-rhamnose isomerase/sugar isomerase